MEQCRAASGPVLRLLYYMTFVNRGRWVQTRKKCMNRTGCKVCSGLFVPQKALHHSLSLQAMVVIAVAWPFCRLVQELSSHPELGELLKQQSARLHRLLEEGPPEQGLAS